MNERQRQLEHLGILQGKKGTRLRAELLSALDPGDLGFYEAGYEIGDAQVRHSATVDARHLRVA